MGVHTCAQLEELGVGRSGISRRLARGTLVRPGRFGPEECEWRSMRRSGRASATLYATAPAWTWRSTAANSTSAPVPFDNDRVRQNAIVLDDWLVLRFSAATVYRDVDAVADLIVAVVRRRRRNRSAKFP
ncbi:MAG: hypothetical protein WBQ44_07425 [Rhodococcus sp. (in: high G+C Gram-positive bacteria)]